MSSLELFQLQKGGMWLCKSKSIKKMDKCPNKVKKRKKEEDSPYSLAKVFNFQTIETCFRRA
jgi:hypothetical protein